MTDAAGEISPRERRSLWAEVIRWPLSGGMLGGVLVLTLLAIASASAEGGYTTAERDARSYLQAVIVLAAIAALGHYGWRAVACTYPVDRPVPWGSDPGDEHPLSQRLALFLAALAFSFLPLVLWVTLLRRIVTPAGWVNWVVMIVTALLGAYVLPLGLAANVATGNPFSSSPLRVRRMRRAEPHAARIAGTTSVVFVVLLLLSFWLATFAKRPFEEPLPGSYPNGTPDALGMPLRIAIVVLRAGGFYAGLVAFRVAGLLVRDVPEVREAIR